MSGEAEGEVHPSVSKMTEGDGDTGCEARSTKTAGTGFGQDSGDPNSRLDNARNIVTGLRHGCA